jgi:hypothetical protein
MRRQNPPRPRGAAAPEDTPPLERDGAADAGADGDGDEGRPTPLPLRDGEADAGAGPELGPGEPGPEEPDEPTPRGAADRLGPITGSDRGELGMPYERDRGWLAGSLRESGPGSVR